MRHAELSWQSAFRLAFGNDRRAIAIRVVAFREQFPLFLNLHLPSSVALLSDVFAIFHDQTRSGVQFIVSYLSRHARTPGFKRRIVEA
eukprot:SAG31_NODE_1012_length_10379_cov_3.699319_2_plen_88_part_00